MCPECIASAAWVAAGVTSTGGLSVVVATLFRSKPGAQRISSDQEKIKTQKEK
jgi:hypothetical protein